MNLITPSLLAWLAMVEIILWATVGWFVVRVIKRKQKKTSILSRRLRETIEGRMASASHHALLARVILGSKKN